MNTTTRAEHALETPRPETELNVTWNSSVECTVLTLNNECLSHVNEPRLGGRRSII